MPATRTILAKTREGLVRIENIPHDAKITFGAVQPGKYPAHEHALRIYTSQTNQLAVIVGVTEFRDESLTITRRVKKTRDESKTHTGPKGIHHEKNVAVDYEWLGDEDETFDLPSPVVNAHRSIF